MRKAIPKLMTLVLIMAMFSSCNNNRSNKGGAIGSNNANRVYVAPGEYDEFYAFFSGGFTGNLTVYGLPSGRMFKEIPVFSQFPTNGYG